MKATLQGYVLGVAETHPLQSRITFVVTDFQSNSNGMAIPESEAENVLKTIEGTPFKINYDGVSETGHNRAIPIGYITNAKRDTINGSEVILADAMVWRSEYPEEIEYIQAALQEGKSVGTSWELFYKDSILENSVEWLRDIVMAASAIVRTPAYGKRTPILAIAESKIMEEKIVALEATISDLRTQMETVASEKQKLHTDLIAVSAELDGLKAEKLVAEELKAKEQLIADRSLKLAEAGVEVDTSDQDLLDFLSTTDDTTFHMFVRNFSYAKKPAQAEASDPEKNMTIRVPNTLGKRTANLDDIATALNAHFDKQIRG